MRPPPQYKAAGYKGSGKLEGKAALVTGGDSGIGRAVAVLFAREGANVAITHLAQEASDAEETRQAVDDEGCQCLPLEVDVSEYDACESAVRKTVDEFGGLDILVNNAAYQEHLPRIEDLTLEQWDHTFRTNIYGYFHMVKAALPYLEEGAVIINCGSRTGLEGSKNAIDYAATNGAIHAFTKSLAMHLIDRGIRVNGVAPGPVWTPLNPADRPKEKVAEFGSPSPMGRPAQPDEISPAFVYLASNVDSRYVTGEIMNVLGGDTTSG